MKDNFRLQDVVDIEQFQRLQDRLHEIYPFPSAIIDNDGNVLTATAWQDVCSNFHRTHPEGLAKCIESDKYVRDHVHEARPTVSYRCPHGLMDNATPIFVAGRHVANYFTGQFFSEEPDLEFFRLQARGYGFDEEAYLTAVARVPICPPEKVLQYLDFIRVFVDVVASIGQKNLDEQESREMREAAQHELRQVLLREITERKKAAETLDKLTQLVPGVIYQYQLNADGSSCFPYSSTGMNDIYEVTPEEVRDDASKVFTRIHPDDLDATSAAIQESARTLAVFHWDFRVVLPRQGLRWRSCDARPERLPDGGTLWYGIITDVTDKKETEAAIVKLQKLESLGTLAGGIAHDFNNVLTAILGNVSLAQSQLESGHPIHELLQEAVDACGTAKGLSHQLLTFAKGGAPVIQVLDLRMLLAKVSGFSARGTNATCVFDLGDSPLAVRVDKDQIAQVVQNLIINATQATPQGGEVHVSAASVDLAEDEWRPLPAGRYVRVTVRDHGVGIPKELLGRIFDPYFTTKVSGRGLGLAVCHSVITKHGGTITASSEPGNGATVVVHLPAADVSDLLPTKAVAPLAAGNGRVLVMDDEAPIAKILKRLLSQLGYHADAVADGQAALDAYRGAMVAGAPYDAVILDLTIRGGIGGEETMRRLATLDPKAKGIVSSGYSNDPTLSNYATSGFIAVLNKPYSVEEVAAVLARVIGAQTH
jgi:signal transduction histidine kinase/ligand-binding sensor protein/ActR/RegA family two-component response regulator